MPRRTKMLPKTEREAVKAIVHRGATYREIASQNGTSTTTVERAVKRQYAAVLRARKREDLQALDIFRVCVAESLRVIERARKGGGAKDDDRIIASVARLENQLKLVQEAAQSAQDLATQPQWIKTRKAIVAALQAHPEAMVAVVAAMEACRV